MIGHGRTVWWAKDSAWWRRERIVELGEEFGAAGPAVIDWLSCEAKLQNDAGRVKAGVRTCGRGCFVDPVTVGHVLSRSVTLGLLDDYEEAEGRFTCRISGWAADQKRIAAADRKAAERARRRDENPDEHEESDAARTVTERDPSRSVTPRHEKSLNRTEQNRRTEAPQPPSGGRSRDRSRFDEQLTTYAAELLPDVPLRDSVPVIRGAIGAGHRATDDVLRWIRQWHPHLVEATA